MCAMMLALSVAAGLILYALKQNINVFLTPSQIASAHLSRDYHFRLGGMVKTGSVVRDQRTMTIRFIVTDLKGEVPVQYTGVLPDLFREGTGVIAEGALNPQDVFVATQLLAKHDEKYMPKAVYQALRENHT